MTQYLDLTYKYLISRGELVKKVAKYPHVDDYRRSVQSLDEKQFVSMRFVALELRNHYVSGEEEEEKKKQKEREIALLFFLDKCPRSFNEKSRKDQTTTISANEFNVLREKLDRSEEIFCSSTSYSSSQSFIYFSFLCVFLCSQ